MSIENISNLIVLKKEAFFDNSDGKLLNEVIKKRSDFIISGSSVLITLTLIIVLCIAAGLISTFFIGDGVGAFLITILSVFPFSLLGYWGLGKYNKYIIETELKENIYFKKDFFDSYISPLFFKQEIDSEMNDILKLNLSLDQYKTIKLKNKSGITYKDVSNFINDIQHTNEILKEIEAEKYSVEYDNIKKEIQQV